MNHEVEVSNLMFNKTSEEKMEFKKYDINVELEEESSTEQQTILKYSLDLTSNPKNSVINITGNAILNGEQEEIEGMLKQDESNAPQIVSLIYQELFPLMYIISKNMKIPSPAHTISQNNITENIDSNPITNDNSDPAEESVDLDMELNENKKQDENENVEQTIEETTEQNKDEETQ